MAMGTDPIADLLALQRDMDRVMERFGARTERPESDGRSFWMPTIDVYKQGDDMVVRAEVPGVSPNEISVSVTGNMLTVKGERRKDEQVQEGDWVLHESRYGSFERRVTLARGHRRLAGPRAVPRGHPRGHRPALGAPDAAAARRRRDRRASRDGKRRSAGVAAGIPAAARAAGHAGVVTAALRAAAAARDTGTQQSMQQT